MYREIKNQAVRDQTELTKPKQQYNNLIF
jgi:hypothetical protein